MRNTEQIKNDIVAMAGRDAEYRERLLASPREAVSEVVGADVPDGLDVAVHVESAEAYHLVIPPTHRLSSEQLEAASGGNHWFGTTW